MNFMYFIPHIFLSIFQFCNYRPQTKFAKVMFSQVFVCPRGGSGLCPEDLHPGVGVSFQDSLCPGGVSVRETPRTETPPVR